MAGRFEYSIYLSWAMNAILSHRHKIIFVVLNILKRRYESSHSLFQFWRQIWKGGPPFIKGSSSSSSLYELSKSMCCSFDSKTTCCSSNDSRTWRCSRKDSEFSSSSSGDNSCCSVSSHCCLESVLFSLLSSGYIPTLPSSSSLIHYHRKHRYFNHLTSLIYEVVVLRTF